MHRFFVPASNIEDKKVYITDKKELKHMSKVLRLGVGDNVIVFDGKGSEYEVIITETDKEGWTADIIKAAVKDVKPKVKLSLVQGIAKGEKMDTIIQKAVEVGITSIYPVLTEHTVVKLDALKGNKKVERWQNIALEACKQCRRNTIPEVLPVTTYDEIIEKIKDKNSIMLYEKEDKLSLREVLKKDLSDAEEIFLLVGPEGGFSNKEVDKARASGTFVVTLGEKILRTETAAIVGSAIVLYELGHLG
ncbi:MAG: 16S rRNA (uracil(1498)-N(3))-methyltransferase [Syntrophomonadaceae bacterium]|nr:16S rRNA (uracil(1498)-N(3))-methyltransferase [Syntrophomonadaceae bacterium]